MLCLGFSIQKFGWIDEIEEKAKHQRFYAYGNNKFICKIKQEEENQLEF